MSKRSRLQSPGSRIIATLVVLSVLSAAGTYVASRWMIGGEPPSMPSSYPPHWLFAVDKYDHSVDRDGLIAFRTSDQQWPWKTGTMFIKLVRGVPGDRVIVNQSGVFVNGAKVGDGLSLARRLGRPETVFYRNETVPQGCLWVMGTSEISFDSRYWGCLPRDRVVGRAHVVL